MKKNRGKYNSGFTLVEMITVVVIVGLILSLLSVEFISVVDHTIHTRADIDAESQARVIMSKVETHLRTAYYDYVDAPAGSPNPVVAPVPGPSTPSTFVTFYRVQPGQMPNPAPTCPGPSLKGAPCPPFELVTIQLNPLTPTELDEIVTLEPSGKVEPTTILGNNVSNFGVTAVEDSSGVGVPGGEYDIALTVTEPSNHCVNDQCSFTLNDVVYLGGQQ